ncbi:MAG TPA: hypothetical protein PK530_20645 [Anaerolineales bacterium]|nr:hypothetical protein [Anaerolineales bacterium]
MAIALRFSDSSAVEACGKWQPLPIPHPSTALDKRRWGGWVSCRSIQDADSKQIRYVLFKGGSTLSGAGFGNTSQSTRL